MTDQTGPSDNPRQAIYTAGADGPKSHDIAGAERQPKGDHNRRLALGLDEEAFATLAGITAAQLHEYELTLPDHPFDTAVAQRVGQALDALERNPPAGTKVANGPNG